MKPQFKREETKPLLSVVDNGLRVYVRWRLEALTFQLHRKFDRRTNVE